MRTDPKSSEFVVVSGARRRDYGGDKEGDESLVKGGFVITTERERAEQRESAFGKLEKTIADREQVAGATQRIGELRDAAERLWDDPYAQNRRLREAFRAGRHVREREAATADKLKERMGLGIELLPETEEDARRAGLVDFGAVDDGVDKALARPLFGDVVVLAQKEKGNGEKSKKGSRKLKSEVAATRMRESLVSEIVSNTRAAKDPFLDFGSSRESTPKGPLRLPGLKRKRPADVAPDSPLPEPKEGDAPKEVAGTTALVNYNSDSD
jgi:coiled-coil domain-containing protein 130